MLEFLIYFIVGLIFRSQLNSLIYTGDFIKSWKKLISILFLANGDPSDDFKYN
jgi:hypothetical protein